MTPAEAGGEMETDPSNMYLSMALDSIEKATRSSRKSIRRFSDTPTADEVHHARVASRRLRTALRTFTGVLADKRHRAWKRPLRRLSRAMGRLRDTDVQLAVLDELHHRAGPRAIARGVDRIRLRLRQRRDELLRILNKLLRDDKHTAALNDILRTIDRVRQKHNLPRAERHAHEQSPDPVPVFHGPPDGPLPVDITGSVNSHLDALLAFADVTDHPEQVERLHAMRIAVKRLRYTLEMYEPMLGNRAADAITAAREMQELLGEIHDCDVWLGWLPIFTRDETQRIIEHFGHDRPMAQILPGLAFISDDRSRLRDDLFRRFVALMRRVEMERVLPRLRHALITSPPYRNDAGGHGLRLAGE